MMNKAVLASTSALLLSLAACGSTTSAPLTASKLAHKIPGAHACITMTPDVLAKADVSCALGADSVEVVTFTSMGNEQRWITGQGSQYGYGCCVEGHLFAAFFSSNGNDYFALITKAIGGRAVNG